MVEKIKRIKILEIKKLVSILLVLVIPFISGCGVRPRVIDDLAVIFGLGIEIDEEDNRILKISTSSVTQEENAELPLVQTTVKAYGIDGFIRNWQYQRHKRLAIGKVQAIIFGQRVIRDNFVEVFHELREVPELDINSRVMFFDGDPQHILNLEVNEEQRVAIYLRELIERNIESAVIPDVNVHSLFTDIVTRGKTAYLPYIEENEERTRVIIRGLALLDNDGRLAHIIDELEMFYFLLLTQTKIGIVIDSKVDLGEGKEAVVIYEIIHNKVKFDTRIVNGKPEINVRIEPLAEIRELNARDVDIIDEETFDKLSEEFSKRLTVATQQLIEKMQEQNVDPVGFGEIVRVKHKNYFRNDTWEDDYPTIKITNEVRAIVTRGSSFNRTY